MNKAINTAIILFLGLVVLAIVGGFSDALTSKESAEIMGGCLVGLAVLGKLPDYKKHN